MSRTATKSITITVAAGVLTFAVQQLTTGDFTTGLVGVAVGLLLFLGYQLAEEHDHAEAYNEIVNVVGQDTLEELSRLGARELDDLVSDYRGENSDDGD